MSNDITSGNSKYKYDWNPFQDIVANRVEKELIHCDGPTQPIIIPRCFPFFAKNVTITVNGSDTPLSFENGDYSFVYPYMTFLTRYQNLTYGGILLNNINGPVDYQISYDTIGGDFVLNDINYAELIANTLNNPRTINIEQIVNFPTEFPTDPHDHPIKDTFSYVDMLVALRSYIDTITNTDLSLTLSKQFNDHIQSGLQVAHKGSLADLGITHLKDLPVTNEENIKTESTEILTTLWAVKKLIRGYINGEWS